MKDEEVFHESKKTCIYNIDTDLTSYETNILSVKKEIMEEDVSYEKKKSDVSNINEDLMDNETILILTLKSLIS